MPHKKHARKCADTRAAYDGNVPDPDGTRAAAALREEADQRFIRKLSQVGRGMGMSAEQAVQFAGNLLRQTAELGERYRSVRR